jgi:hypothetical protein
MSEDLSERLKNFYDDKWFSKPKESSVWLRYYSLVGIPWDDFSIDNFPSANDSGVRMLFLTIEGQEYISNFFNVLSDSKGNSQLDLEKINRTLPFGFYIIFTTPYIIDGKKLDEKDVAKKLDSITSMLRMHLGNNFLRDIVREGYISIENGDMKEFLPSIDLPNKNTDGPFLSIDVWKDYVEVRNKFLDCSSDIKNRIELSLEFFEMGANERSWKKFFYYWVGIEVLLDDPKNTKEIANKLGFCYRCDGNSDFIQKKLFLNNKDKEDGIFYRRRKLFHKGVKPENLNSGDERYIQCMFLDLLRGELGLECKKYMENMINSGYKPNEFCNNELNIIALEEN